MDEWWGGAILVGIVHPRIAAKTNGITNGEIDARIPMDDHKYVENELGNAERVGEIGPGLGPIEEFLQTMKTKESIKAHNDWTGDVIMWTVRPKHDIKQVRGGQWDKVKLELIAAHIIDEQFIRITHQ